MLTLEELATQVDRGDIDTVVVAITDMQGRLQGKRFHARHFLDEVAANGTEGCNYLLAVDVEMNTVEGYEMSSWARGYGDFAMTPDFSTLRPVPWQPGSALVLAEVALTLGALRHEAGPGHLVADAAQQRLDPGRAEQRVVDVVEVGRLQVAEPLLPGLLVGVLEDDELELGAGEGG